jgi:hypothetical protein
MPDHWEALIPTVLDVGQVVDPAAVGATLDAISEEVSAEPPCFPSGVPHL